MHPVQLRGLLDLDEDISARSLLFPCSKRGVPSQSSIKSKVYTDPFWLKNLLRDENEAVHLAAGCSDPLRQRRYLQRRFSSGQGEMPSASLVKQEIISPRLRLI
jgi:hypothetical protein